MPDRPPFELGPDDEREDILGPSVLFALFLLVLALVLVGIGYALAEVLR